MITTGNHNHNCSHLPFWLTELWLSNRLFRIHFHFLSTIVYLVFVWFLFLLVSIFSLGFVFQLNFCLLWLLIGIINVNNDRNEDALMWPIVVSVSVHLGSLVLTLYFLLHHHHLHRESYKKNIHWTLFRESWIWIFCSASSWTQFLLLFYPQLCHLLYLCLINRLGCR